MSSYKAEKKAAIDKAMPDNMDEVKDAVASDTDYLAKSSKTYEAEGDPYKYEELPDGSITITEGPTGKGVTLTHGVAFQAIKDQIKSGQLKKRLADPKAGAPSPMKAEIDAVELKPIVDKGEME